MLVLQNINKKKKEEKEKQPGNIACFVDSRPDWTRRYDGGGKSAASFEEQAPGHEGIQTPSSPCVGSQRASLGLKGQVSRGVKGGAKGSLGLWPFLGCLDNLRQWQQVEGVFCVLLKISGRSRVEVKDSQGGI
jgi:hypothetical protein